MSERLGPVQSVLPERRWRFRRREDARVALDNAIEDPRLPTAETIEAVEPPDARERLSGFAAFAAQLLGQPGIKRGLRGGPETLEKARTAYLEAEYSGPAERRLIAGRITKTKV